jgi:hypothetical protein
VLAVAAVVAAAKAAAAAATKNKQDDNDTPAGIISKVKHIITPFLPLRAGLYDYDYDVDGRSLITRRV